MFAGLPMKKRDDSSEAADADAFARAMADEHVVPLSRPSHRRMRAAPAVSLPPVSKSPAARNAAPDADEESGGGFAAPGVDRRELRKLRRGDYPPSDRHDLHGMTAREAAASVQRFIAASRGHQRQCVCIVHGRGLRSPGGVSVLKTHVRALLSTHPAVLAFADAPPSDGGSGAVYVLLRRQM
jgi:DNA-nicking Smr family endonuclease